MLSVQDLTKSYDTPAGPLTVLKGVTFSLAAGDACAVVGPSGSGKTTLLGLCAGLDSPSSGTVRLGGRDLGAMSEDERARLRRAEVGFVFQSFQLIPNLTALENVMVPLELQGDRQARSRGVELLRKVGLESRLGHYPSQLSGGEQQRVGIARAFINRPKLLFADEPTGNLDSDTAETVERSLFEMNESFGAALVLVTHHWELARRTDRILRLKGGVLVGDERVSAPQAS